MFDEVVHFAVHFCFVESNMLIFVYIVHANCIEQLSICGGADFDDVATISTARVSGAASEELAGAPPLLFRAHFAGGASSRLSLIMLSIVPRTIEESTDSSGGHAAGSGSSSGIKVGAGSSGSGSKEIAETADDDAFDMVSSSTVTDAVVSEEVPPVSGRRWG